MEKNFNYIQARPLSSKEKTENLLTQKSVDQKNQLVIPEKKETGMQSRPVEKEAKLQKRPSKNPHEQNKEAFRRMLPQEAVSFRTSHMNMSVAVSQQISLKQYAEGDFQSLPPEEKAEVFKDAFLDSSRHNVASSTVILSFSPQEFASFQNLSENRKNILLQKNSLYVRSQQVLSQLDVLKSSEENLPQALALIDSFVDSQSQLSVSYKKTLKEALFDHCMHLFASDLVVYWQEQLALLERIKQGEKITEKTWQKTLHDVLLKHGSEHVKNVLQAYYMLGEMFFDSYVFDRFRESLEKKGVDQQTTSEVFSLFEETGLPIPSDEGSIIKDGDSVLLLTQHSLSDGTIIPLQFYLLLGENGKWKYSLFDKNADAFSFGRSLKTKTDLQEQVKQIEYNTLFDRFMHEKGEKEDIDDVITDQQMSDFMRLYETFVILPAGEIYQQHFLLFLEQMYQVAHQQDKSLAYFFKDRFFDSSSSEKLLLLDREKFLSLLSFS